MKEFALAKVYQLLEPGPVVLLTTARRDRRKVSTPNAMTRNVMTLSWHMMVDFEPPLVACIVSSADHSYAALCATRECVIAIPAATLAPKVVQIGNSSGRDIDKFVAFGLTPMPAAFVGAPLIRECFANLECKIVDTRLTNKYGLFILEVLRAWTDPKQKKPRTLHHQGNGKFVIDGETIKLPSRMP